jgi:hypothetical protein
VKKAGCFGKFSNPSNLKFFLAFPLLRRLTFSATKSRRQGPNPVQTYSAILKWVDTLHLSDFLSGLPNLTVWSLLQAQGLARLKGPEVSAIKGSSLVKSRFQFRQNPHLGERVNKQSLNCVLVATHVSGPKGSTVLRWPRVSGAIRPIITVKRDVQNRVKLSLESYA